MNTLDVLTVTRPYRNAVTFEAAQKEILTTSGTLFDPLVVEAFLKAADELKG